MGIEDAIIAQQTMLRQNVAMAMLKQSADMQKQIAGILAQSVESVPASRLGSSIDMMA